MTTVRRPQAKLIGEDDCGSFLFFDSGPATLGVARRLPMRHFRKPMCSAKQSCRLKRNECVVLSGAWRRPPIGVKNGLKEQPTIDAPRLKAHRAANLRAPGPGAFKIPYS